MIYGSFTRIIVSSVSVHVVIFRGLVHEMYPYQIANLSSQSRSQHCQMFFVITSDLLLLEVRVFILSVESFSVGSSYSGFVTDEENGSKPAFLEDKNLLTASIFVMDIITEIEFYTFHKTNLLTIFRTNSHFVITTYLSCSSGNPLNLLSPEGA